MINMSAKLSNANKFTMVDTLVSTQGNDRTLSHTVTQPYWTFVYNGILGRSNFVFFRNSLSHSLVSICATIGMIFSNSLPHAEKVQWDHSPRITHSRFLCLQFSHQFVHVFFADLWKKSLSISILQSLPQCHSHVLSLFCAFVNPIWWGLLKRQCVCFCIYNWVKCQRM